MLYSFRQSLIEREKFGLSSMPLTTEQPFGLIKLLQNPPAFEDTVLNAPSSSRPPSPSSDPSGKGHSQGRRHR